MNILDSVIANKLGGSSSGGCTCSDLTETVGGDTLRWDGNTEGLVSVGIGDGDRDYVYKISDAAPTITDLRRGGAVRVSYGGEGLIVPLNSDNVIEITDGVAVFGEMGCFSIGEAAVNVDLDGIIFPEAGLYIMDLGYTWEITITSYTGFPKTTIKEAYLPPRPELYVGTSDKYLYRTSDTTNADNRLTVSELEKMANSRLPIRIKVTLTNGDDTIKIYTSPAAIYIEGDSLGYVELVVGTSTETYFTAEYTSE